MHEAESPNAEFICCWNDILAPKFTRYRRILVDGLGLHSERALEQHGPRVGDRVLDVGCGFGETALDMGRRVGGGGEVVGIDCTATFIERARSDAARAGLDNVRFLLADAQTYAFEPTFDLCFSRFGTMFFAHPVAALRNLGSALKPGGRLLMVVWRTLEDNEFMRVPRDIAQRLLPPPPEQGQTCGPGPFSMADRDMVTSMLTKAGFDEIVFEQQDASIYGGADLDEMVELQLLLGPAGELMREAGAEGEARRPAVEAALREAIAPYKTSEGVKMPSSSWCITARKPS